MLLLRKMKWIGLTIVAIGVLFGVSGLSGTAFAEAQHEKHLREAVELLQKMVAENDSQAFVDTIQSCKAVAIFPSVIQAGLGIGGMGGEGVVLVRNGKGGWNGPSFVSLAGASIGLQFGVQEVGLLLAITNEEGLRVFTGGSSFKLGADVSIAAGPVGRDAGAATDSRAKASIYSYSMSRGLFAGLTFSGSTINVNGDANKAYWGKALDAKTALSRPADNKKVTPLVAELKKISKK